MHESVALIPLRCTLYHLHAFTLAAPANFAWHVTKPTSGRSGDAHDPPARLRWLPMIQESLNGPLLSPSRLEIFSSRLVAPHTRHTSDTRSSDDRCTDRSQPPYHVWRTTFLQSAGTMSSLRMSACIAALLLLAACAAAQENTAGLAPFRELSLESVNLTEALYDAVLAGNLASELYLTAAC